jgi:FixJ family two-component response regulator
MERPDLTRLDYVSHERTHGAALSQLSPVTAGSSENLNSSAVYVVDDDESLRISLDDLFRSFGLRVQAFASPQDFISAPMPDVPSCLVLDVRLRGQSGLAFQNEMARSGRRIPIVFMTGHGDIRMTVTAMKAGAIDFLVKPFRDQDMLDAVTHALEVDRVRRDAERVFARLRVRYESLTTREREVLSHVTAGLLNKQIADQMNLSEITVKIHRGNVMKKMNATSAVDLVRKAEILGIPMPGVAS